MNRLIAALKRIRLGQILTAFLAGVLLFVSTACSSGKVQAETPNRRPEVPAGLQAVPGKKNPRPEVPDEANTSTFSKGGMNDFSDVDPRINTSPASEKAKALVDNAEKNMIDQTSNLGENTKRILDKKGENAQDFGENLKRSTEETKEKARGAAEDVAKETKQTVEDAKNATRDATRDLTKGVNQTAEDLKQTVKANTPDPEDLTRGVKQAAKNVKENTASAATDVVDKAQRTAEETSDTFQDKVNQVLKGTQKTLYKAGDAAGDAAN